MGIVYSFKVVYLVDTYICTCIFCPAKGSPQEQSVSHNVSGNGETGQEQSVSYKESGGGETGPLSPVSIAAEVGTDNSVCEYVHVLHSYILVLWFVDVVS